MDTTNLDSLATLSAAMDAYRAERETSTSMRLRPEDRPGAKLAALNKAWSKTRAEHEAKLAPQREQYERERVRLLAENAAYKAEHPRQTSKGRPKPTYPDAVKIAAYRAFTDHGKTAVRLVLGTSDTAALDAVLTEGKRLHEAQPTTDSNW